MQPLSQEPLQVPFAVGDVIAGKYEVTGLLGTGGMGYVISARHAELGEMVALKFLRSEALAHPELVERFAREARAAAKIRSEHIANVFDVGSLPDGTPYIVMEYLAGKDLADYLHQVGALPISVAVDYILQACEALAAAHACGIVHRDIKPENLFLIQHGQGMDSIKVLDFGISKVALPRGKRDLVRTQMALGSPVYMSPEQIRRSDQVDARSDIWAVGCVLFELLTGVTAFDEPSLLELSAAILEREPVPLQTLRPDANEELEQVVLRCLSKNPDDRYQNVAELAIALYPFAPRRARISVERSFHILRKVGVVSTDLQLSSAYPPALDMRSRSLSAAMTPRLSMRSTTPAAVEPRLDEVPVELRPKRGRVSLLIGLSLMVAAGALAFLGLREPSRESAAAPRGADLSQSKSALAPAAPPVNGNVLDLDNEPSPPSASASASGAPRTTSKAGRAPKAYRPAATATVKRPHGDDELDPGF